MKVWIYLLCGSAAVAVGVMHGMEPWHAYGELRDKAAKNEALSKAAEESMVKALDESIRVDSPLSREERARAAKWHRKDEFLLPPVKPK